MTYDEIEAITYDEIEAIVLGELRALLATHERHVTVGEGDKAIVWREGYMVASTTPLLAEGAPIDSFDLVNLVVAIEERLEREGHTIEILDEHATTGVDSPFRTVASLARHVHGKCSP